MPPITILWDSVNTTLDASPDPYYAGQHGGGARAVNWQPGSGVDSIEGIEIVSEDGNPYDGDQPTPSGRSNQWAWNDPETGADQYVYTVSAAVSGVGVQTLDPRIINT